MNKAGKIDANAMAAAKRFEDALSSKPIEEQIAVGLISKNVLNGCSWEFVRTNPEIRQNLEAFKNSKVCNIQKVTYNHQQGIYGYLVYMKMDHLCNLLGPANNGPLEDRDLQIATQHRQEAIQSLAKKMSTGYKGRIGIFCTNDSQSITVAGKTFPAYAITLKELCTICNQMNYGIVINNVPRKPADILQREDGVIERLTVAPSSNALFIDIAPLA